MRVLCGIPSIRCRVAQLKITFYNKLELLPKCYIHTILRGGTNEYGIKNDISNIKKYYGGNLVTKPDAAIKDSDDT